MAHRIDTSASSPAGAPAPASVALWLRRLPLVSGVVTTLLGLIVVESYVFGSGPEVSSVLMVPQTVPLAALIYAAAVIGVTLQVNVPLNETLATVAGADANAASYWKDFWVPWASWNHVRSLGAILAFLCLLGAYKMGWIAPTGVR